MKRIALLTLVLLSLVLSACNLRGDETQTPSPEEILTQVVETVHASLSQTAPAATSTPVPTDTPLPTATPSETPLPTATLGAPPTQPPLGGGGNTSACDLAAFVSDVTIPDGTQMAPGAAFTKTWRLRNAGTCTWNANYRVIFVSGEQMGGVSPQAFTTGDIPPGATVDVSVALTAPLTAGTYTGYWKLQNAQGAPFETSFYVQIVVTGDATATVTPTATATGGTPTPTATATTGATPTPTNTTVATATDTAAPTATDTVVPTATDTVAPAATDTPVYTATDTVVPTATETTVPSATP